MWRFHTRFCIDTLNVFDTSIYCASEISLTLPKSEVTDETCRTLEAELFDTLDDLSAKFDNLLVHLAVNGIILKFRHWVSF